MTRFSSRPAVRPATTAGAYFATRASTFLAAATGAFRATAGSAFRATAGSAFLAAALFVFSTTATTALAWTPAPHAAGFSLPALRPAPFDPEVAAPRIEEAAVVDGSFTEAAWSSARVLSGFSQYQPEDGRPAIDSTIVRVWYGPTAIYFGIEAFAPPNSVRATLADRDKIDGDDHVEIVLDTFNDQRQAYVFGVNPFGVQSDGILRDASGNGFGLGDGGVDRSYQIDRSPDFVYQSAGRVTANGYQIEVAIPFKSLRYQSNDVQTWGLNVIRRVQYSGYEDTWAPILQSEASFLAQSGQLTGLTGLSRGLVLDVTPEATASMRGNPGQDGWEYDRVDPEFGGNVRWGITNNLTVNATVNPDFSQVEADAAQIQYDPRSQVFFEEKRPFFLDGIELFQTPTQLIYTRRIADPDAALKLAGKVSSTSIAALTSIERIDGLAGPDHRRFFNVMRLRHDLPGQSFVGAAYTDRFEDGDFNRVFAADGQFVLGGNYTIIAQGAISSTRRGDRRYEAPHWLIRANRSGRHFGFTSHFRGLHPDFEAQSGFISRGNIVSANFIPRISRYPTGIIERWDGSVTFDGIWAYDRFAFGRIPDELKVHINNGVTLPGGWKVAASLLLESWLYPSDLYTNYFVERHEGGVPIDTVAYTGTHRIHPIDVSLDITTPRFQQFSGNVFIIGGQDIDFNEWARSNILLIFLEAEWRPTEQLRFGLSYDHHQNIRPTDWSITAVRRVPRLKVEYQLTRALFLRFVGQYDAYVRDRLRDATRTEDPILIYDPESATYSRTSRIRRNDFRVDWLVSYRPVPGTVFFFGYGSTLSERNAFRFRGLDRQVDGFFVKASYLIRAGG